jgi:flagellar hook-associated protein 3 FlgL
MSIGGVSALVQNGLLARLVADSSATQAQMDGLTRQASSGQVADTYGGLGATAHVSIDLRPQMAQVTAWQQNIATAAGQLSTTQSVLGQLSDIASSFSANALGAAMGSITGATAMAVQAKAALQQVVGLLNTQAGGQYVFGGAQSQIPPIDTTALATYTAAVGVQVAGLNPATNIAALIGGVVTQASASTFAYQNTPLTRPAPATVQAQTGPGQSVPVGFVAGANTFAQQAGAGTTGSYVRDLIGALAGLAGLDTTQANEPTLQSYGAGISQLLQGANAALSTEEAGFGQVQSELTTRSTALSETLTSLTTQVSGVEDVDMTATATALSQVQTQLQASYKLIAGLQNLSLVSYL